jgi:CheY-like chemotaxis protein
MTKLSEKVTSEPSAEKARGLILIIEDSECDSIVLQACLRQIGVINPIETVLDGVQAIAYLEGTSLYSDRARYPVPSIIFLDLRLPRVDAHDFLHWLRAHPYLNGVFAVVISGVSDLDALRRAYANGANWFLAKPFSATELEYLAQSYPALWERALPLSSPA